jgi:putative membrane protein
LTAAPIVWNRWTFEPAIVIPTVLILLVYGFGVFRRRASLDTLQIWRHISFAAGMAIVYLSLESPLDGLADHLFWIHQIQHLVLRMVGPMLIALSMPQATLISGLPSTLRRSALAPFAGNFVLRALFTVLTNAWVVTALFIAALFVWQYPPLHNAAILDDRIHDVMHVTMLAAGLLFWWRIFDMRRAPLGLGYGSRLMMIWISALSQIGLGAYLALKSTVLYPAYDQVGRLFGINPLTDEITGGFIIWVPSAMMLLVSAIIVIHIWAKQEERAWAARPKWTPSNSDAMRYPTTGAALIELARPKNRKLAISVVGFVFAVFAMTMFTGVLYHLNGAQHNRAFPLYAGHIVGIH